MARRCNKEWWEALPQWSDPEFREAWNASSAQERRKLFFYVVTFPDDETLPFVSEPSGPSARMSLFEPSIDVVTKVRRNLTRRGRGK